LEIPHWVRLASVMAALFLAQFLAYQNSTRNLATVIEEKRQLSMKINEQADRLEKDERAIRDLRNNIPHSVKEPKNSLRRRTMQLADEIQKYILDRANDPNRPPFAGPNSNEPNPSEDQKKAIQQYRKYEQETLDYYFAHYRDRMIGTIKEYDAKGVKTGYLESGARQRPPIFVMPGSVAEGTYMDDLYQFRELAYHVDGQGNLIVITP